MEISMNAHSDITQWRAMDTQGRIEAIRQAWFPGCSTAKIAAQLEGVTRNAIIGMYHRFPNSLLDKPLVSRGPVGNIGERKKKRRASVTFLFADKTSKPLKAAPIFAEEPILCGKPLTMLQAKECRWPVNDAEPSELHLFCGLPSEGSYCGHHLTRSYRPSGASS
ncbi:GcrA family cell cycle regulator [Mesorhizobium sp.]|uniref:GcrA family cell cycle regulator n=1 Tax=Mesorhizobium sp. TaxID=1871066 RepID=UPI00257EB494|nr:GcrA family cell cycle regulator [Mesorhizobium sp.]